LNISLLINYVYNKWNN